MNKFLPIITGIIVGLATSFALISINPPDVAYGDEGAGWWNGFVAAADGADFNWNSVLNPFNPSEKAKNLYNLIYEKVNREGDKKAIKEVAASYGLTTSEAQSVIGGSIIPIFNNPNRQGGTLTQEDARKIMANIQENYALLQESYEIQEEVEIATMPSEIFANGDTSDSGFDLINDLSIIEEILFFEKTPSSVGGLYSESLTSPYNPVVADATLENYVSTYQGLTNTPLKIEEKNDAKVGKFNIGEVEKSADVLDSDVCEESDPLSDALNKFDKLNGQSNGAGAGGGGDGVGGLGGGLGGLGDGIQESPSISSSGAVKAAPADDWLGVWCLGQDKPPEFPGGIPEVISLGGIGNTFLQDGTNPGNGKPFSADVSLCLDLKLVKASVSSYQPGQSCIQCEVEKINEYLEKTLSHSLIPNKATGNLLESAKCKDSGTLFNMQFITIWNPVPTPQNDDIIFGKNIFEEWNKYVDNYQPSTDNSEEQSGDKILKILGASAPSGVTQVDLFDQVANIKAKYEAEATYNVEKFRQSNDATNVSLYFKNLLAEIQETNALFKNYKNTFINIDKNALSKTLEKETK